MLCNDKQCKIVLWLPSILLLYASLTHRKAKHPKAWQRHGCTRTYIVYTVSQVNDDMTHVWGRTLQATITRFNCSLTETAIWKRLTSCLPTSSERMMTSDHACQSDQIRHIANLCKSLYACVLTEARLIETTVLVAQWRCQQQVPTSVEKRSPLAKM